MGVETNKKPSRFWYVLDFIFLGIIIPYFVYGICMPLIHYRCGLENNMGIIFGIVFIAFIAGIPFIIAIIGEFIIVVTIWPRRIKSGRKKEIIPLIASVILFLVASFGIFIHNNRLPDYHYMKGFGKYIQKNINISDVREWLETIPPEVWEDHEKQVISFSVGEEANWLSSQPMVQNLGQLSPSYIFVYKDDENNEVIDIDWGGGFIHWGVIIGNENTPMEKSENFRGDKPTWKIQNGVYSYMF